MTNFVKSSIGRSPKDVRDKIIKPVVDFLKKKFGATSRPQATASKPRIKAIRRYRVYQLYRFAELFRPELAWHANIVTLALARPEANVFSDALKQFQVDLPFLSDASVRGMIEQLPAMKRVAEDSRATLFKASNLWKSLWQPLEQKAAVSAWFQVAKRVSIFRVSTANVESMVSVFTDVVGDNQASMIEETIEASVITRYNHRVPKKRRARRFYAEGEQVSDEEGDAGED